jgi:hypothetical protein
MHLNEATFKITEGCQSGRDDEHGDEPTTPMEAAVRLSRVVSKLFV